MLAMLRACGIVVIALIVVPGMARAGNSDDVVAGSDVALTGGAVVANVHSGAAMWFNPAGVARLEVRSVELTGELFSNSVASAPGWLSIESGEQSEGHFSAVQGIPRALTFVDAPRPSLSWGIGFFFSRSFDKFMQDTVSTAASSTNPSGFGADSDERKSLYHLSSAVAWKKNDKFLLGGGFDIIVAAQRLNETVSGAYDSGAAGIFSRSLSQRIEGGGLQMKLGLQWAPIEEVRIGWMVATPSYLIYLHDETTVTRSLSPPSGAPQYSRTQVDKLSGAWAGVETGLTRLGASYLGSWGWVEADLIVTFPQQTPELGIDSKSTANVRLGGVFRLTDRIKLGAGFFTDFSPEPEPSQLSDTQIDYYGFTLGVDVANRAAPPKRGEDGFYIGFAVGLRYAHGRGTLGGLRFSNTFPDPPAQPGQLNPVSIEVNEVGINLTLTAAF